MLTQFIFYLLMSVNMQRFTMENLISNIYDSIKSTLKIHIFFFIPSVLTLAILSIATGLAHNFSQGLYWLSFFKVFFVVLIILIVLFICSKVRLSYKVFALETLCPILISIIDGEISEDLFYYKEEISKHTAIENSNHKSLLAYLNSLCCHLASYPIFVLGKENYISLKQTSKYIDQYLDAHLE